ncbi:class I SAM-dependent methyltransferase [bacterium]|nr:class I SAM-dependent methyltransferase [bacterium]
MSLTKGVKERQDFFRAEQDPGPLTGLALGEPLGRSLPLRELYRTWWAALRDLSGRWVLELGCGYGGELLGLTKRGARAVGLDITAARLHQAVKNAPAAGFVRGDADRLPFANESFYAVIGNAVLLHLHRERTMAELRRVLKPGGVAIFLEPLTGHPLIDLYRRFFTASRRGHVDYPSFRELLHGSLGSKTEVTAWYLTAALPLILVRIFGSSRLLRGLTRLLGRLDSWLFKQLPSLKHRAWLGLVVFRKENI